MERRIFFRAIACGVAFPYGVPLLQSAERQEGARLRTIHNSAEMKTAVLVEGLAAPVKLLQVTDTHISCDHSADAAYDSYSARMRNAYVETKHFKTGQVAAPKALFEELMRYGVEQEVDLLALTGDIVNYPSETAVEFVRETVASTDIPHIYTAGNHDWHYEGMAGSSESLREEWREKRLKPLYGQHGLSHASIVMKGINFVAIDDSTYQVNEEQLAFFREQVARNLPLVLLMHIPLYVPSMGMCCGHPAWGMAADRGFETERRERWSENGNLASTTQFVNEVKQAPCLAAVLTGHWHVNSVSLDANMVQYVTHGGVTGGYRLVDFLPLE